MLDWGYFSSLPKDVLAEPEGNHGRRRMVMVRGRLEYRINLLVHGVEHPAVIAKGLGRGARLRSLSGRGSEAAILNIYQGHPFFAAGPRKTRLASAATADDGHRELRVR